nr:hypothetical protein [Tanacetum cinerariifolium]
MSDDRVFCRPCTCERCRRNYMEKCCSKCCFESGNVCIDELIANYFDDLPNSFDHPPQHQTHYFESYNDNPNYSYPPQERFVYNQDSCYEQNFVDNSQSPPQPQYETNSCELCGNDAYYGYDCPPQVPFVHNQDPCFNQDFDNNFPQTSASFPQQYLCCENCGGPHATFKCQPMNQNFYNSNSFGFNQFQPPQYPVIHHPPQEMSKEMLQARENLMQSIQTFLRKFNRISFRKTPKVLTQAWDKFFEIPHAQPEDIHELLCKLLKYFQIINEELAEYINSPSWNHLAFYDDDDDEYSIQVNEVIKSSVEDLVPIPRECKGILDTLCDVHLVNNPTPLEAKDQFEIVINSNNDYSSSDDDSLYYENIEYVKASPHDSEFVSLECPPTDMSAFTHKEFGEEPAHIISPPEYDYFYFRDLPNSGELISSLNSEIRENLSSTTCVNLPVEDDYSPLLAYVDEMVLGSGVGGDGEWCRAVLVSGGGGWKQENGY